jgi:hypothetical protein
LKSPDRSREATERPLPIRTGTALHDDPQTDITFFPVKRPLGGLSGVL